MYKTKVLSMLYKIDNIGQFICANSCVRGFSTAPEVSKECKASKMLAWQIHGYGGLEELKLSESARIPHIKGPNDVLIRIAATSINPIDLAMMGKKTVLFCLVKYSYYRACYEVRCSKATLFSTPLFYGT
jgi:hypothetical protein